MPYKRVTKPIPFPRAFGATSDAAILSQAAILLLMEPGLRRNRVMLSEYQSARRTLKVPTISATGRRVKVEAVESPLRLRPLSSAREIISARRFRRLADDLAKKKNHLAAASLMEACLRHPHPLVRAAAAWPILDSLRNRAVSSPSWKTALGATMSLSELLRRRDWLDWHRKTHGSRN